VVAEDTTTTNYYKIDVTVNNFAVAVNPHPDVNILNASNAVLDSTLGPVAYPSVSIGALVHVSVGSLSVTNYEWFIDGTAYGNSPSATSQVLPNTVGTYSVRLKVTVGSTYYDKVITVTL
jgi:hypothetical protein